MEASALMASTGTCANALEDLLDPTAELVSTQSYFSQSTSFVVPLEPPLKRTHNT